MAKIKLTVPGYRCERCRHEWVPRKPDEHPRVCPKCKSPYWDKPKKDKGSCLMAKKGTSAGQGKPSNRVKSAVEAATAGNTAPVLAVAQTEVEAYGFIRDQLRDLGWIVKNPNANTGGQVWTQNQCLGHEGIKAAFGKTRPENVVKVREESLWVIESKALRRQLSQAVQEAQDDYCKRINDRPGTLRAVMATGVAGSEEHGYLIRTTIRIDGTWREVTINGQVATGLLSPQQAQLLIDQNISDVHEYSPPQRLFLNSAERINEFLHIGGINKNDRAKTMAALLLSVIDEPPNLDTKLSVLIGEINTRSEAILRQHGKPDFAPFIKILPPTSTTNHVKFKAALVRTIQELQNLNIRSAMNSSTDVLGQFYEVFLKYGNGAKEIGIVLTPRHIARFGVEAIGVSSDDIVLDPACGTGGFWSRPSTTFAATAVNSNASDSRSTTFSVSSRSQQSPHWRL